MPRSLGNDHLPDWINKCFDKLESNPNKKSKNSNNDLFHSLFNECMSKIPKDFSLKDNDSAKNLSKKISNELIQRHKKSYKKNLFKKFQYNIGKHFNKNIIRKKDIKSFSNELQKRLENEFFAHQILDHQPEGSYFIDKRNPENRLLHIKVAPNDPNSLDTEPSIYTFRLIQNKETKQLEMETKPDHITSLKENVGTIPLKDFLQNKDTSAINNINDQWNPKIPSFKLNKARKPPHLDKRYNKLFDNANIRAHYTQLLTGNEKDIIKISRKFEYLESSIYMLKTNSGIEIFKHIHGEEGIKGEGSFTRYKKIESYIDTNNNLVLGKAKKNSTYTTPDGDSQSLLNLKADIEQSNNDFPFVVSKSFTYFAPHTDLTTSSVLIAPNFSSDCLPLTKNANPESNEVYSEGIQVKGELFQKTTLKGMACAVKQLHDMGYIHGDIKDENFLMNPSELETGQIRGIVLADFDGVEKEDTREISKTLSPLYVPIQYYSAHQQIFFTNFDGTDKAFDIGKNLDLLAVIQAINAFYHDIEFLYEGKPENNNITVKDPKLQNVINQCYTKGKEFVDLHLDFENIIFSDPDLKTMIKNAGEVDYSAIREFLQNNPDKANLLASLDDIENRAIEMTQNLPYDQIMESFEALDIK